MPPPTSRLAQVFALIGVLKYGIAVSALLVYLPLTTYRGVPLHGVLGNLFSELTPLSVFVAAVFVVLAAWTVMIVEGLIVGGHTDGLLPWWADKLFKVPLTGWPLSVFTLVLAGPALAVIVHNARPGERLWAVAAIALAGVAAYLLLLLAAAPSAILEPGDPPLRGRWPLAQPFWAWLAPLRAVFALARLCYSFVARRLGLRHLLDDRGQVASAHLFATMAALGFVVLWAITGYFFYPADITAASVAYVYVGLLTLVWFFGALSFHLIRWHVSPLVAVALVLLLGYVAGLDHRYEPAEPGSASAPSIDPIDVAAPAQDNLVIVAAAGGGSWAAGWTARGLEQLMANRPALRREIRLLSAVSGGSVGAAYVLDGLLRDGASDVPRALHDARVRATASSLAAVAYGLAFRDVPRLMTGGLYNPGKDRGQLLEEEWARIAAAPVLGEEVGARPKPREGKRALRSLNVSIRDGTVPAPIFGTTVMEAGQRLMITPITFPGSVRAPTLQEFLFGTAAATPEPDVDLWTAARLSATFTYVSPAARSWLDVRRSQREHLIDGGYYDNYGVAAALDWLTPVLRARKAGDPRLRFTRVLVVELSGFAEPDPESVEPAAGLTATLTGPLTAFLALREGIATSRNRIDLDRFKRSWNEALAGQVQIETVKFAPDASRRRGPLSWHLSSREIELLTTEWGPGTDPGSWPPNLREEWSVLEGFLRGARPPR